MSHWTGHVLGPGVWVVDPGAVCRVTVGGPHRLHTRPQPFISLVTTGKAPPTSEFPVLTRLTGDHRTAPVVSPTLGSIPTQQLPGRTTTTKKTHCLLTPTSHPAASPGGPHLSMPSHPQECLPHPPPHHPHPAQTPLFLSALPRVVFGLSLPPSVRSCDLGSHPMGRARSRQLITNSPGVGATVARH